MDGTIVRVNATFLRWTGFRRDQVVGRRRFQDMLTGGGRIYYETHYAPLLRMHGAVREIALDVVCADGSRLPTLISSTQRRDARGEPVAVRAVVFDASDRRRYEQELVRARDRERVARDRLALLARASRALVEAHEPATRARRLAERLVPGFADWVSIQDRPPSAEIGAVTLGRRPVDTAPSWRMVLPLRGHGGWSGTMELGRSAEREAFDADDQALAADLADRTALALDIAIALRQERAIAHHLQVSLLTDLPNVAGIQLASLYQPAVEGLEVGGDFFDAFVVKPGTVGLVVGDVVGRGLQAAVAMGQLRNATRALALDGRGPARILSSLDRFVDTTAGCRFATLIVGELDVPQRRVRYACAGHPPPLLLPATGDAHYLWDGRSAPLGVNDGPTRPEASAAIPAGAALLLYTDGLIEGRREHPDVALERLRSVCPPASHQHGRDAIAAITAAMAAGARATDDICVLWAQICDEPS